MAAVRFGVPFSETDTVYFGAGIEQTKIDPGNGMPLAYNDYIATSAIRRPRCL